MVAIEAVARLIPGFMHKADSQTKDDHPQFTKPETVVIGGRKRSVPNVLMSGNHAAIAEWRRKNR
jgi:tRNA (guanine37-N1)-methyltransferase